MPSLLGLEHQPQKILKIHFKFAYFSFFLNRLELVSSKTIPDSRPKWAKSIHISSLQQSRDVTTDIYINLLFYLSHSFIYLIYIFSTYTLSDLGDLSNLIGSLSRTIQQYSPLLASG